MIDKIKKTKQISFYFHWPFCLSKCPYCDFNSRPSCSIDEEEFKKAYLCEILRVHSFLSDRTIKSIYFGGGTPSLMSPSTVAEIIETIDNLWSLSKENVEITLEANPSSVEVEKFVAFKNSGVNRISIGVQSFNDADLFFLGRKHNAYEAICAIQTAQNIFDHITFDLIYARPNQTREMWEKELSYALSFHPEHLSLYQLTIEPNTLFFKRHQNGDFSLPHEELAAELFSLTDELTKNAGLFRYEVSNHAKRGCESKHNLCYWNYEDYVGIGPGAHGRYSLDGERFATEQYRKHDEWFTKVIHQKTGDAVLEKLSPNEQIKEALLMGLRKEEGFFLNNYPFSFDTLLLETKAHPLVRLGDLEYTANVLRLTKKGFLRMNAILAYLM